MFYQPGLRRDPVEAWLTWYDIQVRGGTVDYTWLDHVYDLNPKVKQIVPNMEAQEDWSKILYVVRGLEDIIPDVDMLEFEELRELGIQMMTAYKDYAATRDGFTVLVTEHDFSIPIWDYERNCILRARDLREQSPNYGQELEVHQRGRMDAIWSKPNGKLGVIDHKTSSRIDEDFFEKLETDEQVTSYLYAAQVEAKYYGLPYAGQEMEECIYNVMRKTYPKPPTLLKTGLVSVNRAEESPTFEMLQQFMAENFIEFDSLPEKHQEYYRYVQEAGDEMFFVRKLVRRNRHQLRNAGYRAYLEAMDMLDPNLRIYPNLSNDYRCLRCAFRAPCLAKEDGSDWEALLADNYTRT